ncbi:hypothetical protein [Dyadobacter psychrotolerans]|uniref:Uncharacterized protein n=1 Tax=Dyadobacter psychrotolerans TaxID=2541721 RepID=A0A4R5DIL2_9BACT|nr:hypothetical protein [Dyadobacter psychrotolerans]TDE13769.1 hypothetical protein E0F88_17895 [Dyadobacter psychrotolerans]
MNKVMYFWLAIKTVLATCDSDRKENGFKKVKSEYSISTVGKLPKIATESSGLAKGEKVNTFWTHNDSGGKPELYEIDPSGKLLSTKAIAGAENIDWEDLAREGDGTLYIGDFGNNDNNRQTLDIYKLPAGKSSAEKITFNYAGQKTFPPAAAGMIYDCEAFFYSSKNLYLFSKKGFKSDEYVRLYRMPAEPGNYSLSPVDSIQIETQVTSADISPDGKTFALLTYGKVLLFAIENGKIDFKLPTGCFRIVKKQAEALIFLNNSDMMLTNEQGQIFFITRR